MKQSSLLVVAAASLIMVGGGCSKIQERYGVENKPVATTETKTTVTKDSVNLYDAELFLRSRDDVAPGQADVTNQMLFAKTKDGQIVEIVKDVHEALEGRLLASQYLVQEKNIAESNRYAYFIAKELNEKLPPAPVEIVRRLYAFDKEAKKFVDTHVTELTESQMLVPFKYSPDSKKIAIIRREPEQAEIVYIGDVATGNVTHKYEVSEAHTFLDPNTSGFAAFVHPETKWADNNLFQIALFKPNQKAKNGKFEPVDVVVINVAEQLSEKDRLSGEYTYESATDTLFLTTEDGVTHILIAGMQKQLFGFNDLDVYDSVFYMDEQTAVKNSYLIFRADVTGEGTDPAAAVFDKKSGKFLSKEEWPKDVNK